MNDKPNYCYSSGCPLAKKGKGFALGCGDPNSQISILFERPAEDEIVFTLGGPKPDNMSLATWGVVQKWQREELERRKKAFPELDTDDQRKFLFRGAPVRGMSGAELRTWVLPTVGGDGLEGYFLENVLHCADRNNDYPTGDEKLAAEACCTHWNRLIPTPLRNIIIPAYDLSKRISLQKMPMVQEKIHSSQEVASAQKVGCGGMETKEVLQQGVQLRIESRGEEQSVERRCSDPLGVSVDLREDLSQNAAGENRVRAIHSRASSGDGEAPGEKTEILGESTSPERHQNRQSAPESRADDKEPASRKDIVSVLQEEFPYSISCAIWSLHPAGILRDTGGGIVALPLQIDTFSKARSFVRATKKVLILAGGVAAKFWSGYGEAVTKWCGHYIKESEGTWARRIRRIQEGLELHRAMIAAGGVLPKGHKKIRLKPSPQEMSLAKRTTGKDREPRRRARKKVDPIPGMASLGQ